MRPPLLAVACLLSACGGSAPEPARAPAAAGTTRPRATPALAARKLTTLSRSDVVHVIDSGFGTFLEHVEVEPSLAEGRFRGWTIVDLRPAAFWQAVDLRPGDVVTSVNGLPIERDTQAFDAFQSLRTADELRVAYFRDGTAHTLAYRIVQ